jgi:hypothetical protein
MPMTEPALKGLKRWPSMKKALWDVVTGESLNDGHYINAWLLTEKLYAATLSASSAETGRAVEWRNANGWIGELPEWVPAKIDLPPITDRGIAGQIMDAAWPMFGGEQIGAEFWYAFGAGVELTLRATEFGDDPNSILRAIWDDLESAAVEAPIDDYHSDEIRSETLKRLADYLAARGWKDASGVSPPKYDGAEMTTGELFNALVGRMVWDGMDPRSITLGEMERAIDGATLQTDSTHRETAKVAKEDSTVHPRVADSRGGA